MAELLFEFKFARACLTSGPLASLSSILFQLQSWSTLLKVTGPIVAFAASLSTQNPVTGMLVAQDEQDHGLHPLRIKVYVMSYTTFLGLS